MNPNEIPPLPEVGKEPTDADTAGTDNESVAAQRVEKKSFAASSFGAVATTPVDDTQAQSATTGAGAAFVAASQVNVPEIAEDIDLIEKEWVRKAKDIVAATSGDPHKQNNQINRMKVEYIKKRYNKDIKFKEE